MSILAQNAEDLKLTFMSLSASCTVPHNHWFINYEHNKITASDLPVYFCFYQMLKGNWVFLFRCRNDTGGTQQTGLKKQKPGNRKTVFLNCFIVSVHVGLRIQFGSKLNIFAREE